VSLIEACTCLFKVINPQRVRILYLDLEHRPPFNPAQLVNSTLLSSSRYKELQCMTLALK
jgi:hypothetical protein